MVEETKAGLGLAPKEDFKEGDVKMIDTGKPSADAPDARRQDIIQHFSMFN